ncbi:phosphatidylinositol mannoside acyltransferase [Spiractinospora alimapuensis]|uniref:phosphatidylinositol mannoside acyltransferase n=1 Tax=Spiractinospora alimapuensis TaxID=2820884 RepID=UPI001EE9B0D5|nr:phosphatidylinositol mannoside acyltransferase [Spiractinospora alimapuensis]QVQ52050.1 phosphatidylinositol mannoside acyltransferase [Spiractinospora alimapuensis]
MGDRGVLLAHKVGWAGMRWMPERSGRWLFARLADRAWKGRGSGVLRLEENLRRAVPDATEPELRDLARAAMRSYTRYFFEAFRLHTLSTDTLAARTRATGIEELEAHLAAGRGVIAALPHMANWDHAGAWICSRGTPLTTVAERLRPEELFRRFVTFRERLGMEVLSLDDGVRTTETLTRRLGQGRLVCLLADRDLTGRGVEVTLFGEPARLPAGPAALAVATGAALMPVGLWFDGPYLRIRVHPELPLPRSGPRQERVRTLTQHLATVLEAEIAEHPHDWHMLRPVFTVDFPATAPEGV